MAESRVVPSAKVYRHLFDAQVNLSMSLHETRSRRFANVGCLSEDDPTSCDTDTGPHGDHLGVNTEAQHSSEDVIVRNQLFSGSRLLRFKDLESVQALPDKVVSAKTESDVIERLLKKKQEDHTLAVAELQMALSMLSVRFESLFKQTGEDFLCKLSKHDEKLEELLQKNGSAADLEAVTEQDLQDTWQQVSHGSVVRRKWIQELEKTYYKFESEQAMAITTLLKKYTAKLENICFVMPIDVHRLIDKEAMLINKSLLENRRALAKLHLNLMEKDLQKNALSHQRWEDKLQNRKKIRCFAALRHFKDFLNSPEIQSPIPVEDTLKAMQSTQQGFVEERLKILQQISYMIPPSSSVASKWYCSLTSLHDKIDCTHIDAKKTIRKCYEGTWQSCLSELEQLKIKLSSYGYTQEEINDIVNAELRPLIESYQTQTEDHLATMTKEFEAFTKTAAQQNRFLYNFFRGAAQLCDDHFTGLQKREQQLQDLLKHISLKHGQEHQKKEALLGVMMDKLRQESTKDDLKYLLNHILCFLEEVKNGYLIFYKESVDAVESFPAKVFEEFYIYSCAVSRFFRVREVYRQYIEELLALYPSLNIDASQTRGIRIKRSVGSSTINANSVILMNNSQTRSCDSLVSMVDSDQSSQEAKDFEVNETFITKKGYLYNCQCFELQYKTAADLNIVEHPESFLFQLQRGVRDGFFNHIEEWYQTVFCNIMTVVEVEREKLKSELDLRLNLHQAQVKRIEMDIHNVRADELILHQDRVDRHCGGVLEALANLQTEFKGLQKQHSTLTKDFDKKINSIEATFITTNKSNKLMKLCALLQTHLVDHINIIQERQRQFRQKLEVKFASFREANAQLMKSFKLFSEGGNFSPEEIAIYHKHLERISKSIDSSEEALMQNMEGEETHQTQEAKNKISKIEENAHCMEVDLIFQEKVQNAFTKAKVKIETEIITSNMHKKKIYTMMDELKNMLDADASPDTKDTRGDISTLKSLTDEVRRRCQYLDCCLDPSMGISLPEAPLQGAFAVAARPRVSKQKKMGGHQMDSLLQPSQMGAAFIDDAAVGVIQELLRVNRPQAGEIHDTDKKEKNNTTDSGQKSGRRQSQTGLESMSLKTSEPVGLKSVRRLDKSTPFDFKRFQVFGPKSEVQQGSQTFKASVINFLWEANDILLQLAEDYYKKKELHLVSNKEYGQFEEFIEDSNKKLLVQQSRSEKTHREFVEEFRQQLKILKEYFCQIPEVLLARLKEQYLQDLNQNTALIHQEFQKKQDQSNQKKKVHGSKLRVRLSHPACEDELNGLVTAEDMRQEELRKDIENIRLELQECIKKNADEFVTALATMTENMIFQLDNGLTSNGVDSVHEDISPCQTQAAQLQEAEDPPLLEGRSSSRLKAGSGKQGGSRTLPGIYYFGVTDGSTVDHKQRETAAITIAKTTMIQLKVIEVRNALHQNYEQLIFKELEKVEQFSKKQKAELLQWEEQWQDQVKTLRTLNSK